MNYAKIIDQKTKEVSVFVGTDTAWAIEQGFEEQEVEQAYTGEWYIAGFAPVKPLDQLKAEKLQEVITKCDAFLQNPFVKDYTTFEIDSFTRQEVEAREYLKDNTSSVPFISMLAMSREIPLQILAEKIIEKADAFSLISAYNIGLKQKYESLINNAKTNEDLEFAVEYGLPQ